MRKKQIEERFISTLDIIRLVQKRVNTLELQGKIEITRSLTKDEIFNHDSLLTYQSACHSDTLILKDVVQLLLDHLGLELKKTPEKIQLQVKKDGKKI